MATITLIPHQEQIQAFIARYRSKQTNNKNPYMTHFFKLDGASVSIYTSGKILFQGEKAEHYAAFFGHQEKTDLHKQDLPLVGSDEVGNGSYFGGLAVVASFVEPSQHAWLRQLGVGDSKTLTDQKIKQVAPILEEKIIHQALLLTPSKYNEVIASGYNAVSVKVALHNQAIYLLLEKGIQAQKIVIDAFTSSQNYQKYLKQEKNHFQQPIDLIEKAEGKFLAVAVSSIIARALFLKNLEDLGKKVRKNLPSGAGSKSDQVASQILATYGREGLQQTAKLHFKNTEKAEKLLRR